MDKAIRFKNFLKKAKLIHGDKYDYSLVTENDCEKRISKVSIICKEHGTFKQQIKLHLSGRGCYYCKTTQSTKIKITRNLEKRLQKAKDIHNGKYDYSLVDLYGSNHLVKIICPRHGIFMQCLKHHMKGSGCRKCDTEEKIQQYINVAKRIHDNKYDYSLNTLNDFPNAKIICPKHGLFIQYLNYHSMGWQCPKCTERYNTSKAEIEIIKFIKENYSRQIILKNRKIIGLELDIYLPELNLAFEFNGLYWHCEDNKDKNYHINKTELCEEKGIHIVHIYENEWKQKKNIVKSMILNLLNKYNAIDNENEYFIKIIDDTTKQTFLHKNHLNDNIVSTINIGLFIKNELLSILVVKINNENYEILCFCDKLNTNVKNGSSKLFSYFLKIFNPQKVISYADRSWITIKNNLYTQLDFKLEDKIKPSCRKVANKIDRKRYYSIYDSGQLMYSYINKAAKIS